MKRNYTIGAALLLLFVAILAGDFYINETRKTNARNGVAGQPDLPLHEPIATIPGNSSIAPVQNGLQNPAQPLVAENHKRATRLRHRTVAAATTPNNIYEFNNLVTDKSVAMNVSNPTNETNPTGNVTAQRSRDYFGQVPADDDADNNRRHRHFYLPDGLGIELGYNQSSLYDNNQSSNIPIGNFNIGLLMNFDMGDHFAFQPGLRYITDGNRLQNELDASVQEKLSLHYLQLPANLVCKIGKVGNARLMIGAGPYVAYLVGAKDRFQSDYTEGSDVISPFTPQYTVSSINKWDWGFSGFAGIQSPEGLFIKASGQAGMTDIMKNTDGGYSNRNYNMMITVGYIVGAK